MFSWLEFTLNSSSANIRPAATICTTYFSIKKKLHIRVSYDSEHKHMSISLNRINWLDFLTHMRCVICEVLTERFNSIQISHCLTTLQVVRAKNMVVSPVRL
jgi:hypothetical protein